MSDKPTVVLSDVSKTYVLGQRGSEKVLPWSKKRTIITALKPVSMVAWAGESVGVIGGNGSGKSTLLNIIAGNESPTTGTVLVSSRPNLLSVSAALQPHLTGYQNAKLGLLAQGVDSAAVDHLAHQAVEWAGVESAAFRPLATYSSGMKARLKFAIATTVSKEILLVDEALATGDAAFGARARAKMRLYLESSGTVFIVSHSAGALREHCNRGLWLNQGSLVLDSDIDTVLDLYRDWGKAKALQDDRAAEQIVDEAKSANQPVVVKVD